MTMVKQSLLVCFFFLCLGVIVPRLSANKDTENGKVEIRVDSYWEARAKVAYKELNASYNPHPEEVTKMVDEQVSKFIEAEKNGTIRRNLRQNKNKNKKRKYKGQCYATNPIDQCFRCDPKWADNRKKLADCALGFGKKTSGGKIGKFYKVTDNTDNPVNPKPGTLRHAVIQKEPLWITFSKPMIIKLQQELLIGCDKTIDGRGHEVHIAFGCGLTMQYVHNVIIHNVHIHNITACSGGNIRDSVDHIGQRGQSDGDGISIYGSNNIWIDHVTMRNCGDGLIDAIHGSTAITISNSHFTHQKEVMLFGASDSFAADERMQITVAFNHFGKGLVQRLPHCRWGFFHIVNNDYTHWRMYAIGGSTHPTIISQGNRYIASDDTKVKEVTHRSNNLNKEEWKNWNWVSQGDHFVNGAFFTPSGDPNFAQKFASQHLIAAKPGAMAGETTKFSGYRDCKVGAAC